MRDVEELCAKLRRWPKRVYPDHRELAHEALELCRDLFKSPRVLLCIDEEEEPWLMIASVDDSGFTWREAGDEEFLPLVGDDLQEKAFYAEPRQDRTMSVRLGCGSQRAVKVPAAVHDRIRAELDDAPLMSVAARTDSVSARLFVGAPKVPIEAMLIMAEAVAVVLGTHFEATNHARAAVQEALEQDRIRVARDLHDGLLQSFTGVVLQLETIHSMLETRPEQARRMVTETQSMIMADQRELRRFVEQLRPKTPTRRQPTFDFAARLEELRERFANQWGVRVTLDVKKIDPFVSSYLGQETFRLIQEAVTNSAKHGGASVIHVGVSTEGSVMEIEVTDNGGGFPFQGKMTLEHMRESGSGPLVLAERITSLNGSLTVDSSEQGTTVMMSVPLGWGNS
jgi:signal transduction histidine kinase